MSERPDARHRTTFRQRDVTAAIRAVRKAGETPARVEIEGGKVVVIIGGSGEAVEAPDLKRELEEWQP